jgi:hypothetical protein
MGRNSSMNRRKAVSGNRGIAKDRLREYCRGTEGACARGILCARDPTTARLEVNIPGKACEKWIRFGFCLSTIMK